MKIPPKLELVVDDERLVSLTFGLTLYTDQLFSAIPQAVLGCYEAFLSLCPPENLTFYSTENMTRHKPVTKRVLSMLETWFAPGAPAREMYKLELKDGEHYPFAPKDHFWVSANEEGSSGFENKRANFIAMAFPPEWGAERTDEMLALMQKLCDLFPYRSAHAGYSFTCSRYHDEKSQTHAWQQSMRHRGIDIFQFADDAIAVGHDGVKGVNWLTVLDAGFVEELGGAKKIRKALPQSVEIIPVGNGLLFKAGNAPQFGDTNRREFLPEYQAVYKLIKPLIERALARRPSLCLEGSDFEEQTNAWVQRFDDA